MTIQLTPKLEARVEAIAIMTNGQFSSAKDVVGAALRLLDERECRIRELDEILSAAERQGAEGHFVPYEHGYIERLKQEAAENFRQQKTIDNGLTF